MYWQRSRESRYWREDWPQKPSRDRGIVIIVPDAEGRVRTMVNVEDKVDSRAS